MLQVREFSLPGEEFSGSHSDGVTRTFIQLSQYRLVITWKKTFQPILLGLIWKVEQNSGTMTITTKHSHIYKWSFLTEEECCDFVKELRDVLDGQQSSKHTFAHRFYKEVSRLKDADKPAFCRLPTQDSYKYEEEWMRLGLTKEYNWEIYEGNNDFKVCETYPERHVIPEGMSDGMEEVAKYRHKNRFPSVVWRDVKTGAVLMRSSQINTELFNVFRETRDKSYMEAVLNACGSTKTLPKTLHIMDARSALSATVNIAKGGGVERPEDYSNATVQHLDIPNIHAVRNQAQDTPEGIGHYIYRILFQENGVNLWKQLVSQLLEKAKIIADVLHKEGNPVLVHCSDGWDRTSELTSLAELILDPEYRTCQGFRKLVEREWLLYGHKFHDRCITSHNEQSPIFIQWLDCVHQLQLQYPRSFEFNESYLLKLAHHAYSQLFGTFLYNSQKERVDEKVRSTTYSVWAFLDNPEFRNSLFDGSECMKKILQPISDEKRMQLWTKMFCDGPARMQMFAGTAKRVETGSANQNGVENGSTNQNEVETSNATDGSQVCQDNGSIANQRDGATADQGGSITTDGYSNNAADIARSIPPASSHESTEWVGSETNGENSFVFVEQAGASEVKVEVKGIALEENNNEDSSEIWQDTRLERQENGQAAGQQDESSTDQESNPCTNQTGYSGDGPSTDQTDGPFTSQEPNPSTSQIGDHGDGPSTSQIGGHGDGPSTDQTDGHRDGPSTDQTDGHRDGPSTDQSDSHGDDLSVSQGDDPSNDQTNDHGHDSFTSQEPSPSTDHGQYNSASQEDNQTAGQENGSPNRLYFVENNPGQENSNQSLIPTYDSRDHGSAEAVTSAETEGLHQVPSNNAQEIDPSTGGPLPTDQVNEEADCSGESSNFYLVDDHDPDESFESSFLNPFDEQVSGIGLSQDADGLQRIQCLVNGKIGELAQEYKETSLEIKGHLHELTDLMKNIAEQVQKNTSNVQKLDENDRKIREKAQEIKVQVQELMKIKPKSKK